MSAAKGLEILGDMESSGIPPDKVTYETLIGNMAKEGDLDGCKDIMGEMKVRGISASNRGYGLDSLRDGQAR